MPFVKPREQALRRYMRRGLLIWEPFFETRYNVLRRDGYDGRVVLVDAFIPGVLREAPVTTVLLARKVDPGSIVDEMPLRAPTLEPLERSPDRMFRDMWGVYEKLRSGSLGLGELSPVDKSVLGLDRPLRRVRIAMSILLEILEEGLGFRKAFGVSVAYYRLVYYPLLLDRGFSRVYDLYLGQPSSIYTKLVGLDSVRRAMLRYIGGENI